MYRNALIALVAPVVIVSGLHAQPTLPADAALAARVDEIAAKALQEPGAAGLSIAVARGDTVIVNKGYGLADLESQVPATDATLFRIASVTKQYTAAAVLKLVEQGKVALDDDITKYVDYPTQGKTITIRNLLNHTSGIHNYTDMPGLFDAGTALDLAPEKVLEPVRNLPLDFDPGTQWSYSNSGYHLLGMLIEKVSGKTYAAYMQDELFTPLGLSQTRYDVASDVIPGRAHGYSVAEGKPRNAPHLSMTIPYAAGGLLSTAGDLVTWERALVAGKVVSPASYTLMTTPATLTDGTVTDYGFGLRMRDIDGHPCSMHGGGINGFNSMLAYFPGDDLTIAVISSSEAVHAGRIGQQIAREAFGTAPKLQDLALPAAELEALTGNYRIDEIKLDFKVTVADGKLFMQGTGEPPVPVLAQGGREFRADWDPSLKITFDAPAAPGEKAPSFTLEQGGGKFKAVRVP